MVLLNDIKGQDNALRYLRNSLSAGRIANGYLFVGPLGVGKATAAKGFLMELMCGVPGKGACGECAVCRRVDALNHPDIMWIKPEKAKRIRIGEIRKAKDMLSLKPYESSVSACVIEDAHLLTREAANALLKVLEEPPGRALVVLISGKRELLLPTVISRCMEVRFHLLSADETRNILLERSDINAEDARFLANFSGGSPGRAIAMAAGNIQARKKEISKLLDAIAAEEDPFLMAWDREDRTGILEDLEFLIMFLRDAAAARPLVGSADPVFFDKYSTGEIYDILGRLIDLKRALEGNVNPKLVAPVLPGILGRDQGSSLDKIPSAAEGLGTGGPRVKRAEN
ncbi:MAG: DNA polymerase III subunit delta' [Candidatus Omnitrophica bacterium]|nr:DNA polymerase III subunit delta' [Candidatus Omnitrophota bacterium]MBU1128409.1 DNA polymerase III subunit delta' [Candidatus Omnitrophota bacterium]MBU1852289.1 DNA polymerase III subunit delta' [Candidatus Omnitrophota bacterium]